MTSPEQSPGTPSPLSAQEVIGTTKWLRLLIVTATVLGLFAVCAISIRLGLVIHHTLLLFSLGGLLAYALDPVVEMLRRPKFGPNKKGIPRTVSVLAVFTGLVLCFAGGVWWLGGQLVGQVKVLQRDAPGYHTRAIALARNFDEQVLKPRNVTTFSAEDWLEHPPKEVNNIVEEQSKRALPILAHTASNLAESGVVVFIALYLLIFSADMKEKFNGMLPEKLLTYALPWEKDVNRILGGFVRGQLTLALLTGAIAAVMLLLVGVHLWLIIGLFVVAASLIPVFGPYIAAVPATIAALVTPTHLTPVAGAITVVLMFIVINEAGSKILYPKLVGHALNLHEVVVLFVLFAGLEIDGITGTLFAAPVAALSIVSIIHLYRLWQDLPEESLADENERLARKNKKLKMFKQARVAKG